MLANVAVERVANGNFAEKVNRHKTIVAGPARTVARNSRGWLPRWMKFPIVLHHSQRLPRGRSVGQGPVAVCAANR